MSLIGLTTDQSMVDGGFIYCILVYKAARKIFNVLKTRVFDEENMSFSGEKHRGYDFISL